MSPQLSVVSSQEQQLRIDTIWTNARLATMSASAPGLGLIEDGVIAAQAGKIVYAGRQADAPSFEASHRIDCGGRWITPGLIDCHTHLVFAGDRSGEFEQRLAGVAYADIARAGGGILSTVKATRAASEAQLVASALPRLDALMADGVTTIEIKSGYGLDRETEIRQLQAARALTQHRRISVTTTYLGAHAIPFDATSRSAYLEHVISVMIPLVARETLADAVDVFTETIAFTLDETARIFDAARHAGLSVKIHAEQLSNMGATKLAAQHGALSADHIEYLDQAGVDAIAKSGTVGVLLPGAFYALRETRKPPVAALRKAGVAMAVATDLNPGSSPLASLRLAANMACVLFGLTIEEAWLGITRNAATALGRSDTIGTLEPGKACDLAIWDVERLAEVITWMGAPKLHGRVVAGQPA
jgi:imidazolonepropionase